MRGNESDTPQDREAGNLRFPIPMRGNETLSPWSTVTLVTAFPIPMRGNEQFAALVDDSNAAVSNPHEG